MAAVDPRLVRLARGFVASDDPAKRNRRFQRWLATVLGLGMASVAMACALAARLPAARPLAFVLCGVLVPVLFIALVTAILEMGVLTQQRWSDVRPRLTAPAVGARLVIVLAIVGAAFVLAAGSGQEVGPGQPVARNGGYYLVNHGDLTPITESDYEQASQASLRGFVVAELVFVGIVLVVLTFPGADRYRMKPIQRPSAR